MRGSGWAAVWNNLPVYAAVLSSSLTEAWHGPSSLAMVQAVEPYITWLTHPRSNLSRATCP